MTIQAIPVPKDAMVLIYDDEYDDGKPQIAKRFTGFLHQKERILQYIAENKG
jgi:hypothetical protein